VAADLLLIKKNMWIFISEFNKVLHEFRSDAFSIFVSFFFWFFFLGVGSGLREIGHNAGL